MNLSWLTIQMAIKQLLSNKLRSFLTMLGIIIGIASVISIASLGAGAESLITNALQNLGTDTLTILPGNSNENGPPAQALGIFVETLTLDDAEAVRELPFVRSLTPFVNGTGEMIFLTRSGEVNFSGVDENFLEVESQTMASGRFFSQQEARTARNVVVLGSDVKNDFFPLSDPVGQSLKIRGERFTVIGVLDRKGSTLFENLDNRVYVPLVVAQNKLTGKRFLDQIRIRLFSEDQVDEAKNSVRQLLRIRHDIEDPDAEDFSVRSVTNALSVFTGVTGSLRVFLLIIAAISLVVGGIGVVNIMLMSVKERTREIGLKKALGATPRMVRDQFLIETMVLTTLGGVLGILCGILFALLVFIIMRALNFNWSFVINFISISAATLLSVLIGLLFGVYPALKAARLNPIDALRYE